MKLILQHFRKTYYVKGPKRRGVKSCSFLACADDCCRRCHHERDSSCPCGGTVKGKKRNSEKNGPKCSDGALLSPSRLLERGWQKAVQVRWSESVVIFHLYFNK